MLCARILFWMFHLRPRATGQQLTGGVRKNGKSLEAFWTTQCMFTCVGECVWVCVCVGLFFNVCVGEWFVSVCMESKFYSRNTRIAIIRAKKEKLASCVLVLRRIVTVLTVLGVEVELRSSVTLLIHCWIGQIKSLVTKTFLMKKTPEGMKSSCVSCVFELRQQLSHIYPL